MSQTELQSTVPSLDNTDDFRERARLRLEDLLLESEIDIRFLLFTDEQDMLSRWESELRKKNIIYQDGSIPKPGDIKHSVIECSDEVWTSNSQIKLGGKTIINRGLAVSRFIETGIYNYCIETANNQGINCSWDDKEFIVLYRDKVIEVLFSLGFEENEYHRSILRGLVKPEEKTRPPDLGSNDHTTSKMWKRELKTYLNTLATRDEYNMTPWWYYAKDAEDERNAEELRKKELESACTLFTCGRCKQNKTWCSEQQRRSADEPMTISITCINCGLSWKKN